MDSETETAKVSELDVSEHSSAMERIIEMVLLGEICQEAWFGRGQIVDIMHSTVDAFGHDVVLECGDVLRHVQIKARQSWSTTSSYNINIQLAERPSGCIIVVDYIDHPDTKRVILKYRWFGGLPGQPLPPLGDRVVKHTKGDSHGVKKVRPNMRKLLLSQFTPVNSTPELLDRLFGPIPTVS